MAKTKTAEMDVSGLLPTNDYIFKKLFGSKGSEKLTESLIKNFIGIKDIEVEEVIGDKILEKDYYHYKLAILDVQAKTRKNEYINIEMQSGNYEYIKDRLVFYLCKSFGTESIRAGEKYSEVRKTIAVLICKDKLDMLKNIPKWRTVWHIREDEYRTKVLTDKLEIVIIELEKITKKIYKEEVRKDSKEAIWAKFFLKPKELEVIEMGKNSDVKEAKAKYEELLDDYEEARIALSRQMYIMDMNSSREEGLRRGMEAGFEEGKEKGMKKGMEEGKKQGIEEGKKREQKEIAKKMLEKGKSINEIIEFTTLSKQEIEELS